MNKISIVYTSIITQQTNKKAVKSQFRRTIPKGFDKQSFTTILIIVRIIS